MGRMNCLHFFIGFFWILISCLYGQNGDFNKGSYFQDKGEIVEGALLEHCFFAKFGSKGPTIISRIVLNCKCSDVHIKYRGKKYFPNNLIENKLTIEEDNSFGIYISLDTNKSVGPTEAVVFLYHGVNENTVFKLTAFVHPLFDIEPRSYDFGEIGHNDVKDFSFFLSSKHLSDYGVTLEALQPDFVSVGIKKDVDLSGKSGYRVTGKFGPFSKAGKVGGVLRLRASLNNSNIKIIDVLIVAMVKLPFFIDPRFFLGFGVVSNKTGKNLTIKIKNSDNSKRLIITRVELEGVNVSNCVTSNIIELDACGDFEISVKIIPGCAPGVIRGNVNIYFHHDFLPKYTLPFFGLIK